MRWWVPAGGIVLFAAVALVVSSPTSEAPVQKRPASLVSSPEAELPPKSIEQLTREAVEMDLPTPPPLTAGDAEVKDYIKSLEKIVREGNPADAKEAREARNSYTRAQRQERAKEHKEQSKQRHALEKAEREARSKKARENHRPPGVPPHDPSKRPPPPQDNGPAVTGVESPSPSPSPSGN